MAEICKRGALIVLEGCDRTGKTTQSKKLVERLLKDGLKALSISFPDRTTPCGSLINAYLSNKQSFGDEGIHLLFTLNRWEAKANMERLLKSGTTIIVDRYSFSGVAFSNAKGLDYNWCRAPEAGLLKPDLVLLLTLSQEAMSKRGGFGEERYETLEMQKKVLENYMKMKETDGELWREVDADKTSDSLTDDLEVLVKSMIDTCGEKEIKLLWD